MFKIKLNLKKKFLLLKQVLELFVENKFDFFWNLNTKYTFLSASILCKITYLKSNYYKFIKYKYLYKNVYMLKNVKG